MKENINIIIIIWNKIIYELVTPNMF